MSSIMTLLQMLLLRAAAAAGRSAAFRGPLGGDARLHVGARPAVGVVVLIEIHVVRAWDSWRLCSQSRCPQASALSLNCHDGLRRALLRKERAK